MTLGNNRDFDPKKIVESNYFRRLIVAAEGGMGKSTFLRKICKDAVLSDFFSAVIFISLPSLFPPEGKRCPDPTTDEYYYFTTRLLNNFSKDETDMILSLSKGERDYCNPVLIVLDGYNELVSCSDTRLPEIKAEIGRISKDDFRFLFEFQVDCCLLIFPVNRKFFYRWIQKGNNIRCY